jgi:hypothetical protein
MAMADDGHVLATHICSAVYFMPGDLGIDGDWSGKHKTYNEHFGEGNWQLEWVDDARTHPGLLAAYALNVELGKKAQQTT